MSKSAMPPVRRTGRARRHRAEAHSDNNDRWLLTYADMITLLLVLFIVLFALSKIDEAKYKEFEESVTDDRVIVNDSSVHGTTTHPPHGARTTAVAALRRTSCARSKRRSRRPWPQRGMLSDVTLSINSSGLVEGLVADSTFFQVDSANLSPTRTADRRYLRSGAGPLLQRRRRRRLHGQPGHHRRALRQQLGALGGARHLRLGAPHAGRRGGAAAGGRAGVRAVSPCGAEHVTRGAGTEPTGQHRRQTTALEHGAPVSS